MVEPQWIEAWAFGVYDVLVFAGLLYAAKQIREARASRHSQAYMDATARLQNENLRRDRAAIFAATEPDWTKWEADLKNSAERVAHNFDQVGLAIKHGLFPARWVLLAWRDSLQKSWNALEGLVKDYQAQRGREFWSRFEALGEAASRFQLKVDWRAYDREEMAEWKARRAQNLGDTP